MVQWRFIFGQLNNIDGLIVKCLNNIPQYGQAYPAAKSDVSASLERMVEKGFRSNENLVWHKITHGQRRYYLIKTANDAEEVRVRIGHSVFGKSDRDLKILKSRDECHRIIRQFLVRWNNNGSLPGWKTIWSVFNVANYDVSERRIKLIYKIIQDNVTREPVNTDNIDDSNTESTIDRSINLDDFDGQNQDNEDSSRSFERIDSYNVLQLLLSNEDNGQIQSSSHSHRIPSSIINDSTVQVEEADNIEPNDLTLSRHTTTSLIPPPSSKDKRPNITSFLDLDDTNKENNLHCETSIVGTKTYESTNSSLGLLSSSNSLIHSASTSLTQNNPTITTKQKRQRRIYATKGTPYATRRQGQLTAKQA